MHKTAAIAATKCPCGYEKRDAGRDEKLKINFMSPYNHYVNQQLNTLCYNYIISCNNRDYCIASEEYWREKLLVNLTNQWPIQIYDIHVLF